MRKNLAPRKMRQQSSVGFSEKNIYKLKNRSEKFGNLITADHKVLNEDGESRNYHRTLSLFKILLLIGLIQSVQRVYESSSSRRKTKKLFVRKIHWNWDNLLKIYNGHRT